MIYLQFRTYARKMLWLGLSTRTQEKIICSDEQERIIFLQTNMYKLNDASVLVKQ